MSIAVLRAQSRDISHHVPHTHLLSSRLMFHSAPAAWLMKVMIAKACGVRCSPNCSAPSHRAQI